MNEESDVPEPTTAKPTASAWPMLIAVGLAVSEVGVLFGLLPVSVFGLLLFSGSIAGILREVGYVDSPWTVMAGFAAVLVAIGGYLFVAFGGSVGGEQFVEVTNGVSYRGLSIALAGVFTLFASVYGRFYAEIQPNPGA
jgi:hypothetical protein